MRKTESPALTLTDFVPKRPVHEVDQQRSLDWLVAVHAAAETSLQHLDAGASRAFETRIRKLVDRAACGPDKIARRGHVLADVGRTDWNELSIYDVSRYPQGKGTAARARVFERIVDAYFDAEYGGETEPPGDLIHVTCTGYASPSGAQKTVSKKGWGDETRVTHAYQMGCYAAFPATRLAAGCLQMAPTLGSPEGGDGRRRRVDIVHTELCSLHLDPSNHSLEQLVVQSLFADGFIRYSMREGEDVPGLRVLCLAERILEGSADAMSWTVSDAGMQMTLARDVPERIAGSLRGFVADLYSRAGMSAPECMRKTVFAVHPGGPRIIDGVQQGLELTDTQVRTSREVLREHGNMSSATLPHIWSRVVADGDVPNGTLVLGLAFGPGLTVCGGLFRKQ